MTQKEAIVILLHAAEAAREEGYNHDLLDEAISLTQKNIEEDNRIEALIKQYVERYRGGDLPH